MSLRSLAAALCALTAAVLFPDGAGAATDPTRPTDGYYVLHDFPFTSGESLPELRLHYTTFGTPHKDARGHINNAVLIMHGTGGSGNSLVNERFSAILFKAGGVLDASKYYLILPDALGHGKSSKPSDGLRARFPKYGYRDMVNAQYQLVTKGLGVDHLRLVMGTSMGCMHTFLWGTTYPDMMDALMPLACLPVQIAGRNRVWRELVIETIREDPEYLNGDYKSEPRTGIRMAAAMLMIAGSAPIQMQLSLPTREAADEFVKKYMSQQVESLDANDFLYQVSASSDYDPSPDLEKIKAPLLQINSGDDFINPPELGIAEQQIKRIKNGRFILLPASEQTHGHGTHTWAAVWQQHLAELMTQSKTPNNF